jgi:hypothetical protein
MALFKPGNNILQPSKEIKEEVIKEEIKKPVFESETPIRNIIKQISGHKWFVDYYNAVTTKDDFNSSLDLSTDLNITEYNLIRDAVIIVESPLENTKPENLEGSGYIDLSIIPHNGDFFIAKLMDGRLGVFQLTGAIRETYNLERMFKINYKLFTIIPSVDDPYYKEITAKVINTYYYNKDYLRTSDKPILSKEEVDTRLESEKIITNLINLINSEIITTDVRYTYSYKTKTGRIVHDPQIEDFLLRVVERNNLHPRLTTYGLKDKSKFTILDLLLKESDKNLIKIGYKKIGSHEYGVNPYFRQIFWVGINNVVIPDDNTYDKNDEDDSNDNHIPTIKDDCYIFTQEFYDYLYGKLTNEDIELTTLEKMLLNVINDNPIDFTDINNCYNELIQRNRIKEIYYYSPLIIFLIKYYRYFDVIHKL